jgi:hypothetical protein
VPVYTGFLITAPATPGKSSTAVPPAQQAAAKPSPPNGRDARHGKPGAGLPPHEKHFKEGENEIASQVAKDVEERHFAKALSGLDEWARRFPDSDFKGDRFYYYIVVQDGMKRPDKTVDTATQLLASGLENSFPDPRQMILALYLTSLNVQKLPRLTREQHATGQAAARNLMEFVQSYFTHENKPEGTSSADWLKARTDLETTAKATLTALSSHPPR